MLHSVAKNTVEKKAKEWGSVTSTGSYKQSNMADWLMGLLGSWETKAHRMR